jgi:hypothetical protein
VSETPVPGAKVAGEVGRALGDRAWVVRLEKPLVVLALPMAAVHDQGEGGRDRSKSAIACR